MGSRSRGHHQLLRRLLALSSLLLLASGEVIFEERFEGTGVYRPSQLLLGLPVCGVPACSLL